MIKLISKIVNDTLKKDDSKGSRRWSRTSLTMFTAWVLACYLAIHSFIVDGFRFDVFITLCSIATGVKIADSISEKLNTKNNGTNER